MILLWEAQLFVPLKLVKPEGIVDNDMGGGLTGKLVGAYTEYRIASGIQIAWFCEVGLLCISGTTSCFTRNGRRCFYTTTFNRLFGYSINFTEACYVIGLFALSI
jgi:hypothetical protein